MTKQYQKKTVLFRSVVSVKDKDVILKEAKERKERFQEWILATGFNA